jgi:tripeptide aminopeptidase
VDGDLISSAGDTILGADDKAGVTLILLALRRIIEEKLPHGDLWVVFTVAEETGLWGAQKMDYGKLQPWPELCYVLDGGRTPGVMGTAAPSSASLEITITGCAAHAGVCPERGVSAIQTAAQAIAAMQLGRLDAITTANVGVIRGGSARNIIPEHCTIRAEARSHDPAKLAAQVDHMVGCLQAAGRATGAQVQVDVAQDFTAFALAEDSPVVRRAAAAARRLGREPVMEVGGGGSDANVFNEHGLPSLMMATGAMDVHTPQEQLNVAASLQCLEWLVMTVVTNEE